MIIIRLIYSELFKVGYIFMKKIIQKYKNLIKIKRKILKYKILFYLNSRRKEIEAAFLEQEKED